jgi:hypothetical protein
MDVEEYSELFTFPVLSFSILNHNFWSVCKYSITAYMFSKIALMEMTITLFWDFSIIIISAEVGKHLCLIPYQLWNISVSLTCTFKTILLFHLAFSYLFSSFICLNSFFVPNSDQFKLLSSRKGLIDWYFVPNRVLILEKWQLISGDKKVYLILTKSL